MAMLFQQFTLLVASFDGEVTGELLGADVGDSVICVGAELKLGAEDGCTLGSEVGAEVGCTLGSEVGSEIGTKLGAEDKVGEEDGRAADRTWMLNFE